LPIEQPLQIITNLNA